MYDGLLLDHDGVVVTLVDDDTLNSAARAAFRDVGVADPDPDDVEAINIRVTREGLLEASRRHGVDPDRLWRARDDRVRDALLGQTRNGGKTPYDDVDALETVDLPLGVVSNNQTRIVEAILDHHGLRGHVDTIRARAPRLSSLDHKKPRPTFLENAMDDLAVENPLYVGDSESDVEAGRRAGLDVAFVRRGHNGDPSSRHDPTYVVEGLDDVVGILRGPGG
jgi:phosphoglycolate phosphatase-like HAD superfamily hydrolase